MTHTGGCLCGAVRWRTDAAVRSVFECHCHRCRRLTGDHIAASAVPSDQLDISGGALRWFAPDDDPNVSYGFCAACGSTMFFRSGTVDGSNVDTSITVGSFDEDPGLSTTEVWFTNEARRHTRLPEPSAGITLHPANG